MDTIFKDINPDAVRDLRVSMRNPPSDPVLLKNFIEKVQDRQRVYDEMGATVVKNYQIVQDIKNHPRYKELLASNPMLARNEGKLRRLFEKLVIENGKVTKGTLNSTIVEDSTPKALLKTWNKLLVSEPTKKKAKPAEKEEEKGPSFDIKAFRNESEKIHGISKNHDDNPAWQELHGKIEYWKGDRSGDKWNKAYANYQSMSNKLVAECSAIAEQPQKPKMFDDVYKEQIKEDDDEEEEEVVDSEDENEDEPSGIVSDDDDKKDDDEPNDSCVVDDDEPVEVEREVERKTPEGFTSFCSDFLKTMRTIYDNGHATKFLQSFQPSYQIEIVEDGKVLPGTYKGYASVTDAKDAGERLLKLLTKPSRYTYKVTQQ
jgi:hypothetical protein